MTPSATANDGAIDDFDPFAGGTLARVVPTSEAQREVWLADKLGAQASLAFNESVTLCLRGALDTGALAAAITALVARHESLRSTVGRDGTQLFVGTQMHVDLPRFDWRECDTRGREEAYTRATVRAVETPFDLERGPLFRCELHRLADDVHRLLMTAHHVVCDGWSWGVIAEDIGALYAEQIGLAPGPDEAPQYAQYVDWEATQTLNASMVEHERYWLGRFEGSPIPVLDLPTDRPRAPVRSFRSLRIDHVLDATLVADLRKLGATAGASLFATLFAGFAALLSRLTGQPDLVIGVPAAGQAASDMAGLVGHCVNLLPIRTQVDPNQGFDGLVHQSGATILDAFDHQAVTYGSLLKKLSIRRDSSRLPLVSTMFNVDQATKNDESAFGGLSRELKSNPRHFENFELFLNAAQVGGELHLECQYNTDLFDAMTIRRWLGAYETLLRTAVRQPSRSVAAMDWVADAEMAAMRALQPLPTADSQSGLMHAGFIAQAAAAPARAALWFGDSRMTYADVDQRSNRLARALRGRGIQRGERVGICLHRGTEMIVALLGVLKAGGTYIPLDPSFPPARLGYYAADAKLALLITESTQAAAPDKWRADADQRILRLDTDLAWLQESGNAIPAGPLDARPDDAAYIIYTSGSTGNPKGVCVPHRAVANFLLSMQREPGIRADDRLAAVTTLSFDIAVLELMLPLIAGAEVVIVPRDTAMDGNLLSALLESTGATIMQATPGMWRMLLDTAWHCTGDFKALVGGESCPRDLALSLLERFPEVWNLYGPTETTIWSTAWHLSRDAVMQRGVSIGRPIANTTVWILDGNRQVVPVGVPGEICIGGAGVALGYLDRADLTADRFVADPNSSAAGALMYRTGDRGRWCNDGLLEHLGRFDFQVKVRGYRIELGEIETCCNEVPGVLQSVVLAREDHAGDIRLVAYLAIEHGTSFDETTLRTHLRSRLPEYMLPQHVMVLDAIPLLPNGKIDRKALPAPEAGPLRGASERVGPRNEIEAAVLSAMETVLNLPGLGVHDDFFALGGHSLLAARLTSRLSRDLEINLPLRALFESPTAEMLALAIQAARATIGAQRKPIRHQAGRRTAPLTPMQERIRFVEALHPGRVVYNTPSAHRLIGQLDAAMFETAFREIVRHQPSLRTHIGATDEGQGHQQVIAEAIDFEMPFVDLSTVPQVEREAELMRRMQVIVDTPLDIHHAPLFRVALYKLAAQEHAFLFMPHHIVWDGWSFDLLYEEMAMVYGAMAQGRPSPLQPLAVDYGDFAQWYEDWMRGPEFELQLRYWKQRLATAPIPKAPRPDRPRRVGMSGEGASEWLHVDTALTERLRDMARDAGVTLNMVTMAVYTALMASVCANDTIVVGVPVRGRAQAELEPVMGFFNNLLPVQINVAPQARVLDFVRSIKRELLEVFSAQDVPFERIAAEPEVASRAQHVGIYQALFSFQDARDRTRQWGELQQKTILIFQKGAAEDLGLWLMDGPNGLEGGVTYNAEIYDAHTASAIRSRYIELLALCAADPSVSIGELISDRDSESAAYLKRRTAALSEPTADLSNLPSQPRRDNSDAASTVALCPEELALADIWASLLGIEPSQIRAGDNFFDLGGDSLLAMRVIDESARKLGVRIEPRRYVFESLRQLAATKVSETAGASITPAEVAARPAIGLIDRFFSTLAKTSRK